MKTITKTINLYEYNELEEKAKEKAAEKEIEKCGYDFFYEMSNEEMEEAAYVNGILYLEDGTEYFD